MRGGHKGIKTEPRTYAGARTHMVENCTNENLVDHCLLTRPFKTPYMYIYICIYIYNGFQHCAKDNRLVTQAVVKAV